MARASNVKRARLRASAAVSARSTLIRRCLLAFPHHQHRHHRPPHQHHHRRSPVLTGEFTVTSMSPPPEGHLAVWDCDPTLTMSLVRPAHQIGMCGDGFRASVDVLVPWDISSAMVEILFRDARGSLCAYASSGRTALQAGVRTRFETTSLDLSDHPAIPLLCAPLPFTTTTMAVVLEGTYTGPRLTHTFAFVAK